MVTISVTTGDDSNNADNSDGSGDCGYDFDDDINIVVLAEVNILHTLIIHR